MKLSKWGSAVIGFRVANFNVLEYSVVYKVIGHSQV